MNQYSHFAVEEAEVIQKSAAVDPSDWRLLRRLQIPDRFNDSQGGTVKQALVIDMETTGLSTENDDVIQLALLPFEYEAISGRILTVYKAQTFEGLREPALPIAEEALLITGRGGSSEMFGCNGRMGRTTLPHLLKNNPPTTPPLL